MLLQQVAHYNDLSDKLRKELEDKIRSFGKTVRYKFDISNPNPDPTHHNGRIIWPNLYTLDPSVFNITDPYETREKTSKSKRIAIIDGVDEKGIPNRFRKIRIHARKSGILALNVENEEEFAIAMFLELHPKLTGGRFADKNKKQVVFRIDEQSAAKEQREFRSAKLKALNVAQQMSDSERITFADAMMWDSSDDPVILGNKIEELAETDPKFFNDLVEGKTVEYRAVVQQALNKKLIEFDPAEWKFIWSSNKQPITVLSPAGDKTHVEKMAEWLQIGGEKSNEVYKKIKSLIKV
jgi:hypothetical protein